jgi:hypothetical protein
MQEPRRQGVIGSDQEGQYHVGFYVNACRFAQRLLESHCVV